MQSASTPRFADAVERVARAGRRVPSTISASLSTQLVARLSLAGTHGVGRWLLMDEGDVERAERNRETIETKEQRMAARAAYRASKAQAREDAIRRAAEQRRIKQEQQLERERAKAAMRDERLRHDEMEERRKQRQHRWRQWRYRLGTMAPVMMLKRGLRR